MDIDWPAHLDSDEAATLLSEKGLVESREAMAVFLRTTGGTAAFVPGPHLLVEGASPWELRELLSRSFMRPGAKITIPEGFNRFDIGARLEKLHIASRRSFLAATSDASLLGELGLPPGESAEGFLFPATYEFALDSDPKEVMKRLVIEANRRWEALAGSHVEGLAHLEAALGFRRREIVTLASMIEKEAVVDEERALVASVFVNRLLDPDFKPKRLQSDPTAMYGCVAWPSEAPSCADFRGKASSAINLDSKNRYSTYVRVGLPPGPIANPGSRSLAAAMDPAITHYFYFVASGGGRHTFSESLDAHNDAIRRGRSP